MLISRITNDVQALDQLVTDGIQTLFSSALTLIGTAAILVALDPGLALVTFLTFPVLLVRSIVFRLASSGAYRLTREKIARGHRLPAGDALGRSRGARVRAGARATARASPSSTTSTGA